MFTVARSNEFRLGAAIWTQVRLKFLSGSLDYVQGLSEFHVFSGVRDAAR